MANDNNFYVGVSGNTEGVTDVQLPIDGKRVNVHIATREEVEKQNKLRAVEQARIEAINAAIKKNFQFRAEWQKADVLNAEFDTHATITAALINHPLGDAAYTDLNGKVHSSKKDFVKSLTQDRIAYLENMIEIDSFDLSRGRLQIATFVLATKASADLVFDLVSSFLSAGKQSGLLLMGTVGDVLDGKDVKTAAVYLIARLGSVPIDSYNSYSALYVINDDYENAKEEKNRVKQTLNDELSLLRARLKEIK